MERPYLRVANVHRSRLDLSEIKYIRLTPPEYARTNLMRGDLLLVEGLGNPSEIGRAAVWDGSIEGCVHQNHLIRARCHLTHLTSAFTCEYLNSLSGRQSTFTEKKLHCHFGARSYRRGPDFWVVPVVFDGGPVGGFGGGA